ncbi:MAG TPA: hypothetical protein VGH13_04420 [Xanthobacteraceae bacterium]|jgi:hypothetical protein
MLVFKKIESPCARKASVTAVHMIRSVLFVIGLIFSIAPALADSIGGVNALSLAARIGQYSPLLTQPEKVLLNAYLDGCACSEFRYQNKITVTADLVTCTFLDNNIASGPLTCSLVFGKQGVQISGREAQVIYGAVSESGIVTLGAAGSIGVSMQSVQCTVDPVNISKANQGANCSATGNFFHPEIH